jgi:hypothetical protein
MTALRVRPHVCALLLLAGASCGLVRGVADTPGRVVGAVSGGDSKPPKVDLDEARSESMRFADRIVSQVETAAYMTPEAQAKSPEAAERSLVWKITAAEQAFQIAAQQHPVAALADLVALCAYQRKIHELYWVATLGEADQPLLQVWTALEKQGLDAADRCLPATQSQSFRDVLERWRAVTTDGTAAIQSGAPSFEDIATKHAETSQKTSLLGVIGLDPLDSIEPAARELARSRELAERAVFLAQRMPRTLAWRTELLTLRAARQPGMKSLLEDMERTSKAAEGAVATADALPAKLRAEGDALIQRVSTELSTQRAGIVTDLERTSAPTQALLTQMQQTLDAGTRLSQALDVTTKSVDQFIAHVAPPEPPGAAPKEESPGKPFDPVEYTALAAELTGTLHELNAAAANLDRSLPAVQQTVDAAAARVDRSIDRAWTLAVWLVLIAVGATAAAVLLVRAVSARRQRASGRKPAA